MLLLQRQEAVPLNSEAQDSGTEGHPEDCVNVWEPQQNCLLLFWQTVKRSLQRQVTGWLMLEQTEGVVQLEFGNVL